MAWTIQTPNRESMTESENWCSEILPSCLPKFEQFGRDKWANSSVSRRAKPIETRTKRPAAKVKGGSSEF